jgi:Endonuclease NucS C-terminal domain
MITCTQAIREEFKDKDQILSTMQLINQIQKKYPGKWKEVTIRTHLIGCSINHKASKWYPTFQKFLYTIEPGKMKLFDPEKEGKFNKLSNGLKLHFVSAELVPTDGKALEGSLSIQKDLRKYLKRDIAQLEPGLELFTEEGLDVSVEAAKIDILATDSEGNLVVVKLKGGSSHLSTLGQILKSMASIKNELGEKSVRGKIVAEDFDNEIIGAVRKAPNVSLVKYKVKYDFEAVG